MQCSDCQDKGIVSEMKEGSVLLPVLGNVADKVERGDTIYEIAGAFSTGMKCPVCGHTVVENVPVRENAQTGKFCGLNT